ncbi:MAG: class I SAM-dependent methyltransferase [Acidimicrobiales bacterium]
MISPSPDAMAVVASAGTKDPLCAVIDIAAWRGLEIGPLTNPRVRKTDGPVMYLDHASTDELRAKYATNTQLAPTINDLVDVDLVQKPSQTLTDAVAGHAPFDYVIAAHVVEHIPDVIGWLQELEGVLHVGGVLSLVIPDKRFTFDVNRAPTDAADLVDCFLRGLHRPSFRQIFDFFSRTTTIDGMVDTPGLWAGTANYNGVVRDDVSDAMVHAFAICQQQLTSPSLVDIHCSVLTPASFLDLYEALVRLRLTSFEVAAFFPTARNSLEFFVSLRKVDGDDVHGRQMDSLAQAAAALATAPAPTVVAAPTTAAARAGPAAAQSTTVSAPGAAAARPNNSGAISMEVSRDEQRLLLAKRRLFTTVRNWVHRRR